MPSLNMPLVKFKIFLSLVKNTFIRREGADAKYTPTLGIIKPEPRNFLGLGLARPYIVLV